jgi:hypothetical protein
MRVTDDKEWAMDNRDDSGRESRRKFLKSMALTGGGVAVAAAVRPALAQPAEGEAEPARDEPTGYHETQHIRDYYARASF